MKVALCCIVKNENPYLMEFVEHYKRLGFDHIFFYDNNNKDDEKLNEVIQEHINSNFVTVINYRGIPDAQIEAYHSCYEKYSDEYDWIAFFDADEFLELAEDRNIHTYLLREEFNPYHIIRLNVMIYDDNENYKFENKPLKERFTHPANDPNIYYRNCEAKCILRSGIKNLCWRKTRFAVPNCPNVMTMVNGCDSEGKFTFVYNNFIPEIKFTRAYLKHYVFKSIDECILKYLRGWPHGIEMSKFTWEDMIARYFEVNKLTSEKFDYFQERIEHIIKMINES